MTSRNPHCLVCTLFAYVHMEILHVAVSHSARQKVFIQPSLLRLEGSLEAVPHLTLHSNRRNHTNLLQALTSSRHIPNNISSGVGTLRVVYRESKYKTLAVLAEQFGLSKRSTEHPRNVASERVHFHPNSHDANNLLEECLVRNASQLTTNCKAVELVDEPDVAIVAVSVPDDVVASVVEERCRLVRVGERRSNFAGSELVDEDYQLGGEIEEAEPMWVVSVLQVGVRVRYLRLLKLLALGLLVLHASGIVPKVVLQQTRIKYESAYSHRKVGAMADVSVQM